MERNPKMKKKAFFAALAALVLVTGCGDQKTTSDSTSNSVEHSSQETIENNDNFSHDEEDSDVNLNDDVLEDTTFDWYGIGMNVPADFEDANVYSHYVWKGKNASENIVYYELDQIPDYPYIATGEYFLADTPDIMREYFLEIVDEFFPAGTVDSTISVDSEEQTMFLDFEAIRRTGTIHAEKYGESAELYYAAYYSIIDFPKGNYKKIPAMWVAFSESMDEVTRQDIEDIVDTAAEKAHYVD